MPMQATFADIHGATDPNRPYCKTCQAQTPFQIAFSQSSQGGIGFAREIGEDVFIGSTSSNVVSEKHVICNICASEMVPIEDILKEINDRKLALWEKRNHPTKFAFKKFVSESIEALFLLLIVVAVLACFAWYYGLFD